MLRIPTRRLLAATAATAITTVATIVAGAAPAHAAASGQLLVKGTGSVYTDNNGVNLGIIPGTGTKSFFFKVVNTGSENQQYTVDIEVFSSDMHRQPVQRLQGRGQPVHHGGDPAGRAARCSLSRSRSTRVRPQDEYIAVGGSARPIDERRPRLVVRRRQRDLPDRHDTARPVPEDRVATVRRRFGRTVPDCVGAQGRPDCDVHDPVEERRRHPGQPSALQGYPTFPARAASRSPSSRVTPTSRAPSVEAGFYTTGSLNPGAKKELKVTDQAVARATASCTCGLLLLRGDGARTALIGSAAHVVNAA